MKIQKVPISQIKENPENPRKIQRDKFLKLKKSIEDFPEMLEYRMIVCYTDRKDGKFVPLGGNMRLKALKELWIEEVSIMLADEWTEDQRKKFIVKDNVNFGEWDFGVLDKNFDFSVQIEFGIDRNFSFKMSEEPKEEVEDREETEDAFEAVYEAPEDNETEKDEPQAMPTPTPQDNSGELIVKYKNIADKERIKKILKNFNITFSGK